MGLHHRHVPADRLGSGGMNKHCHGPCQQGHKPCPTPDACELQEPEDKQLVLVTVIVAVATLVIVLTALFA